MNIKPQNPSGSLIKKATTRNPGIDILRGACILAVILLHLNIHFGFSDTFLKQLIPKQIFSLLFWSGYYGVVIFFTLSGYLITTSILTKWNTLNKIDLKTFYWYRSARIIPLLIVLLVLLSVLHLANVPVFVINPEQASLGRVFLSALTFHINWLEIQVGYLPPSWDILWSISIEETFYLVFPLLCFFLRKEWHFTFLLIAFLIISPWARTSFFEGNELGDKNHLAYVDSLALGCMAAIVAARLKFPKGLNQVCLLVGLGMVTLIVLFRSVVYQSGLVDLGLNVTILSFGIALILLWLHEHHRSGNESDHTLFRWLKHMGAYSYEIYLSHMFVVLSGVSIFNHFEFDNNWLVPFSIVIIIISYLLGKLVFIYFSEPVNIWLRKRWTKNY